MKRKKSLEQVKEIVAQGLYDSGFGEDPNRNWFMACFLIDRDDFKSWCDRAEELAHYSSSSESMKQAALSFRNEFARVLYETSLLLATPSTYPSVNEHVADRMFPILVQLQKEL